MVVLGGGDVWLNDGEQLSTGSISGSSSASTSVANVKSSRWLTTKELTATSLAWKLLDDSQWCSRSWLLIEARCSRVLLQSGLGKQQ
ncbi:hypothetical protein NL676_014333 [Syzygium grande]|nr:hypothetical protein NL676_014333 [Syzygium grande]